jgi:hypothetical protein
VDEADLEALIDSRELKTQAWMGDVYLVAEEVEAKAAVSERPKDALKPRAESIDSRVRRIRDLMACGVVDVGAAEARRLLSIQQTQLCKIAREGRVNYVVRKNRRWYLLEDVEAYARLQNIWATRSGGWTAYGKRDEPSRAQDMKLLAPARQLPRPVQKLTANPEDFALDMAQALAILNVRYSRLRQIVTRGELSVVYESKPFGRLDSRGRTIVRRSPQFSAAEVYALAEARDRKQSRAGFTAGQWNGRMVKPFIRTEIVAPENDYFISRAEAGAMLGMSATGVSNLVGRGRLFGWQAEPGKPGSRLFLSANQVARYRDDPDRKRRSEAAKRGPRDPSPLGEETDNELWMEDNGMADSIRLAVKSNLDRQHGDFLNAQQAAKMLGITPKTLLSLRQRGRIAGYQRARIKRDSGGHKWWFFRRTDVEALLLDPDYVRNRDRARAAKLRSMGRPVPGDELTW